MEGLYLKITKDFIPDPKEARFGGKHALIAVEKGDIIFDVKELGDGWLSGKNLNSGKAGKFPANCSADLSSNGNGNGNKTAKATSGPFGLRKTEPRKAEAKSTPEPSSELIGSVGSQVKRSINPRPLKTFGEEPKGTENVGEKEGSGDSGIITDEPTPFRKPGTKAIESKRPKESKLGEGSDGSTNNRGRFGRPVPNFKPISTDKKPNKRVAEMKEDKDQPVASDKVIVGPLEAKSAEEIPAGRKYSEVKKVPASIEDGQTKPNNREKEEKTAQSAAGGATVNIQENPLTNEQSKGSDEGIYQVPQIPPPKPPHVLPQGCFECKEPHVYEAPMNDYSPPMTPTNARSDHEATEKNSAKKNCFKLKPKPDEKREVKRSKVGSYESICLNEGRSTESIKEAVKVARQAKEKFLTSKRCPKMKIALGTSLGLVLGVFCLLILYLLINIYVLTAIVVAVIVGFVTAVVLGFLDATRLKCIVLLIFPSLCSSGCKLALWLILTYFLVSGPVCNFIENVRITAVTRGCMMEPRLNSTSNVPDPRTLRFIDNIEKFENLTKELERYLNKTLFGDNNKSDNGVSLLSGLICIRELYTAKNTCSIMLTSYKNCTDVLGSCEYLSDSFIRNTCTNISSAHLESLMTITAILHKRPSFKAETYAVKGSKENHTSGTDVMVEVEKPCGWLHFVKLLLPLLVLVVLYEAYRYHKHYLVFNEFDNCYLTFHFKSIEDTRKASGVNDGLIPLKKAELQKYVQSTSCRLSQAEKHNLFKYLMVFLVYLVFAVLFLLVDLLFYQAITDKEPTLNTNSNRTTLFGCEAQLKSPDESHTIIISALLGLLFFLILFQAYVLRLRRYIASCTYPTRERKRVTYLYYKLLEDRKAFYKSTIEKINSVSEENDMLSRLDTVLVLSRHFPALGKVFQFLGVSLTKCVVCETGLNRKRIICDTEGCGAVYCRTCFWDLESNCLGCMGNSNTMSPSWSFTGGPENRKKNDYAKKV